MKYNQIGVILISKEKENPMKELIEIQSVLKAPRSNFNKFGGYNFRNCEDILEAVKPLLKKYGCYLVVSDDIFFSEGRHYVKATATIHKGETSVSATAFAREALSRKGMDDGQLTGATSSYARKYALNGLFCIDDTKDADSLPPEKPQQAKKKQPQSKKQPATKTFPAVNWKQIRAVCDDAKLLVKLVAYKKLKEGQTLDDFIGDDQQGLVDSYNSDNGVSFNKWYNG